MANEECIRLRARTAAAIVEYKIYPCVIMASIWLWSRALSNGHPVYVIYAQVPKGIILHWPTLAPRMWKLIVPIFCLLSTTAVHHCLGWGWWGWSLPMGILLSFATLHSGIFGTSTPMKMTTVKLKETDQVAPLVFTSFLLCAQYGRKVPWLRRPCSAAWRWVKSKYIHDEQSIENSHG